MQFSVDDTIAAIASARGGARRGILRVTGPDAAECVGRVFRADDGRELAAIRRATVVSGEWHLAADAPELPGELYWWPGERSYARQPTAEFHTLGSPPLLELALAAVCAAGARIARPGEFTLRAFLAGRIDLTQAEAVLGVIDAETAGALDAALAQLAGGLATPLHALRERLLNLLAHVEAGLDFVTEDIEFIELRELLSELRDGRQTVVELLERMESRVEGGESPRVVLVGMPNAGKSSLFNRLCGDSTAIVSDVPGTTRDYVERRVIDGGLEYRLVDTAGLALERSPDASSSAAPVGEIDRRAQEYSERMRGEAAVELFCVDLTRPLDAWELDQLRRPMASGSARIVTLNKLDAARGTPSLPMALSGSDGAVVASNWIARLDPPIRELAAACVATSSATGEGLAALRAEIVGALEGRRRAAEGVVAATAVRCRESLRRAGESLRAAEELAGTGQEELVAAELRLALEELGEVVGAVYTDDILDRVFSRFCIGK